MGYFDLSAEGALWAQAGVIRQYSLAARRWRIRFTLTTSELLLVQGATAGLQAYNSTLGRLQIYNGTNWGDPSPGSVAFGPVSGSATSPVGASAEGVSLLYISGAQPLSYAVTSGSLPTGLSLDSAGVYHGSMTTVGVYNFSITATDANGETSTNAYAWTVAAVAVAFSPPSGSSSSTSLASIEGVSLVYVSGAAPLTYAVTSGTFPTGGSVDSAGVYHGTLTTPGVYNFSITATDANGTTATNAYAWTVLAQAVAFGPASGAATSPFGASIEGVSLAYISGAAPLTYAVTSGTFPTGGSVDSAGVYHGALSTPGVYNFSIRATGQDGATATNSYSWTVQAAAGSGTAFAIVPEALFFLVGAPFSQVMTVNNGTGLITWTLNAAALPTGIAFNASTATFSGTPTTLGQAYSFSVTATDQSSPIKTSTREFSGSVIALTPLAYTPTSGALTAIAAPGLYQSQQFTIVGGTPGYHVAPSTMPRGFVLAPVYPGVDGLFRVTGYPRKVGLGQVVDIIAEDSNTPIHSVLQSYTLDIAPAAAPLTVVYTLPVPNGFAVTRPPTVGGGGTGPYTYTLLSGAVPGLVFNPATGIFTGSATTDGNYTCEIEVVDANQVGGTSTVTFAVSDHTIAFGPASGTAVSPFATDTTGVSLSYISGFLPLVYTVTSGAVPTGTSLSGAGVYSGVAGTLGVYPFEVTATDQDGMTTTNVYEWTIAPIPVAFSPASGSASSTSMANTAGVSLTYVTGAAPLTYAVTSGSPPTGTTLSSAGAYSGILATPGVYTFEVTATGQDGSTATNAYEWTVLAQPVAFSPASGSSSSPFGTNIGGVSLAYVSGAAPLTYTVTSGTFPTGGSVAANGSYSGVLNTLGTYNFSVTATGQDGSTATNTYSWSIVAVPVQFSPASGSASSPYGTNITGSSLVTVTGAAPVTYAVTAGSLPTGTTLSSAGVYSGTLNTLGTYNYSVTATGADGSSATNNYSWSVVAVPVQFSPASGSSTSPNGANINGAALAYVSGAAPLTYAVTSGTFPTGGSVNSAGVYSGTLNTAGTYNFSITATGQDGSTATNNYSWTVLAALIPVAFGPASGSATSAAPFSAEGAALSYISGAAPLSYSVSGSLPPGLSVDGSGVFHGTVAAGVTGTYNYSITGYGTDGASATNSYAWTII